MAVFLQAKPSAWCCHVSPVQSSPQGAGPACFCSCLSLGGGRGAPSSCRGLS